MSPRKALLETPTTSSEISGSGSPTFRNQGPNQQYSTISRPISTLYIQFDKVFLSLCVVAVRLCIWFHNVPWLNSLFRRLTLMSGSFDTNAMLCLFLRYMYTFLPHPLAFDQEERVFAKLFLEKQYLMFAWVANTLSMRLLPPLIRPLYRSYYGRAKFASEFVERSILDRSVKQVVVLGAGFDSTAYRTADLRREHQVRVFEVDLARVQQRKLSMMQQGFLPETLNRYQDGVVYVECDFGRNDLTEVLLASGYDLNTDTAILWEGVTYYLPRPALERTLSELHQLALKHRGTSQVWLFLDYMQQLSTVDKRHTDSDPLWKLNVEQADALGTSFITGFTDVGEELAKFGASVIRHTTYQEIEADYFSPSTIPTQLSVFVEPNTTFGHNEPYLNLAECLFE